MPVNVEKWAAAGIVNFQWGKINTAGYPVGNDADGALADDGTAYMQVAKGAQQIGITLAETPRVPILGDDGVVATFQFQAQEDANGTLTLGAEDLNLASAAQGTKVYALGDSDVGVLQPAQQAFNSLWVLINTVAKSQDSGSIGDAGYMWTLLKPTLSPSGRNGYQTAGEAGFDYGIVASKWDTFPFGLALSDANNGTTEAAMAYGFSENPITIDVWQQDGAATTFTLSHTVAANSATKVIAYRYDESVGTYGALTFNDSPSTAAQYDTDGATTFNLGAAGDASDVIIVWYEYQL